MNKGWRRIVSTLVAIVIAATTVLVCAPPTSAAGEGHCKPAQSVKAGCSHCPQKTAMDCCATSSPQPASPPQDTQQPQPSRSSITTAQVGAVPAIAGLQPPSVTRTVRGAPLHGYRSTDLPTLNVVFLI
jgi:hypothetical protein